MDLFRIFKRGQKTSTVHKKALKIVMYGCTLANSKQYDDAMTLFQEAIEVDANCADAHFALGLMYAKKGMNAEAGAEYNKAIEINPEYKTKVDDITPHQEEEEGFDIIKELKKNL
ncbi:MAG: tetratricopeptide repeat protein [Candidatus Anammoxibacter sp.]